MKTNETGRSMVEMLGVLAIIGVLSIGGIAGYTMAMNRYRANVVVDMANKYAVTVYTAAQTYKAMNGGNLTSFSAPALSATGLNGNSDTINGAKIDTPSNADIADDGVTLKITFSGGNVENMCKAAATSLGVSISSASVQGAGTSAVTHGTETLDAGDGDSGSGGTTSSEGATCGSSSGVIIYKYKMS